MISQFKRFVSLLLAVMVLVSAFTVPAYAVDDVYDIADDVVLAPVIYYTEDYYPGLLAQLRSSMTFANNRVAHGSYSEMNYNPSWFSLKGSAITSGDFNSIVPEVLADQMDVSAVYSIPNTSFVNRNFLTFNLPNTEDGYFDFQSSNFLFDQQSAQANTFYVNGTLTFNLRNLWDFAGYDPDLNAKNASWYLASDPLAVQLVIDGKAYGDIIDVTVYTSPFTALYNGGIPTNASVTFDNLKVYYQGDTPDMIGFRVYTGSAFTKGQYNYGDYTSVAVTNTVTFRVSDLPDITFVQEGGDSYAGDLSGISGLLSSIQSILTNGFNSVSGLLRVASGKDVLSALAGVVSSMEPMSVSDILRVGLIALYRQISQSELKNVLSAVGTSTPVDQMSLIDLIRVGFLGLATLSRNAQSYVADTVFPWQSYNLQTHQLNTATNITGQNNLFFTAFQSIEDKLGRLAYVFGSDEDLALKDSADPGTDAFRDTFGGGASLSQISAGADVVEGVDGLFDSGYDFDDAFTHIAGESMFTMWFSAENSAAIDSTRSVMVLDDSDPYHMQIYYDRLQEVADKRDWGDD